ncbi:metallophosphoesterase [Hyperthermus butylicus]|uniref:Phosphoesterase n=1 Tax=Hyperthermus butylicus (strain DSM 5456 / JCM 9403 / PLM1-5) TaxID=415426 RepID=A2BJX9_HYPBU|nr:metallophosphoesterase [Hyperthermus butylicus]ABM80290.1 putative phosphoesterase [Hyperthermus butylicus DSM 5456]
MLRLLIISDVHAAFKKLEKLAAIERDIVVLAGDLARCGSVEEAARVLEILAAQGAPVVWVPGNCDARSLADYTGPSNTFNVHGRVVEVNGLVFVGVGGSTPTPFSTPFEMGEDEVAAVLSKAFNSVAGRHARLVLVTHSPPYASGLDRIRGGEYVGSKSVRKALAEARPLLAATGHIHEAWGVASVEGVTVVNPGSLAEGRYAIALVDLEMGVVVVRTQRLG